MARIELSGSGVEYIDQGRGEPAILLHCSAGSSAQWRGLVERLSGRFRVLAPDLYGCGATARWPGREPFRLEHEAGIVRALLERAAAPAHLVGHSYGGAVALHVARTRPDLLASLTLIEPVAFHLLRRHDAAALAEIGEVAAGVAAALVSGDYLGGMARFVDYWSGPGAWAGMPEERRTGFAGQLAKVALDFHATLGEPASLEDFARMALPTLILQGSGSPRPARRICELLAGVLRDARCETLPGAGHMAPLTHRESVNRLVSERLSSLSRAPAGRRCAPRSAGGWRTGPGSATGSA